MYLLSIWIRDLVKPKRVCQTLLGNGVEYSGVVRKWDSFDRSNGINSSEDTLLLIHAISHSFKKHISIVFSSFSLRLMLSPTIEDIIGNSNSYSIRRITKLYFSYILNIISLLYTRVVDRSLL